MERVGSESSWSDQGVFNLEGGCLDGTLNKVSTETDPIFGFAAPTTCPGVNSAVLNARRTWADPHAYDEQAQNLARLFAVNFKQFSAQVPVDVRAAGPGVS